MATEQHVTEDRCNERHGTVRWLLGGVFAAMTIFVVVALYAVSSAHDAEAKATKATSAASAASAKARLNKALLVEIHTDIREVRAAVSRIERNAR